jgi:hypothetical protein
MADSTTTWLTLVYKIPSEPSRLRASVWRRLKSLGAVYLQNSVAVMPSNPEAERALRALRHEIVSSMEGTAVLLRGLAIAGDRDITAMTIDARNDEYDEIVDKCHDFLAGIDKEIAAEHFTYGELEENEEDLTKLRNWFDKVVARDVLAAGGRGPTEEMLHKCASALADYAQRVYAAEDV